MPDDASPHAQDETGAEVRRLIKRRCSDPDLGLSDVASALELSERQVQRKLRASLDLTFRGLLLEIRMERARKLLESERMPSVELVAKRVGYRGPSGLRQAFVRYWGVNPSSVRPNWDLDAHYDRQYQAAERS